MRFPSKNENRRKSNNVFDRQKNRTVPYDKSRLYPIINETEKKINECQYDINMYGSNHSKEVRLETLKSKLEFFQGELQKANEQK